MENGEINLITPIVKLLIIRKNKFHFLHVTFCCKYVFKQRLYRHPFVRYFSGGITFVHVILVHVTCKSEVWYFDGFISADKNISGG